MVEAVSFHSVVPGDGLYEIVFVKTGLDTGSLDIREWNKGVPDTSAPSSDKAYALTGIRMVGGAIECDTSVGPLSPHIRIVLPAVGGNPVATITVTKAWWFNMSKAFPMDADDIASVQSFLKEAAFPAG